MVVAPRIIMEVEEVNMAIAPVAGELEVTMGITADILKINI